MSKNNAGDDRRAPGLRSGFRAAVALLAAAGILLVSVTFSGEVHPPGRKDGRFFSNMEPRDHSVDGKQITLIALDNADEKTVRHLNSASLKLYRDNLSDSRSALSP